MSQPNWGGSFLSGAIRLITNFSSARSTWISLAVLFLFFFFSTGIQIAKYMVIEILIFAGILLTLVTFVWCIYSLLTESSFADDMRAGSRYMRQIWNGVNYNAFTVLLFVLVVSLAVYVIDEVLFQGHLAYIIGQASERMVTGLLTIAFLLSAIHIGWNAIFHPKKKKGH